MHSLYYIRIKKSVIQIIVIVLVFRTTVLHTSDFMMNGVSLLSSRTPINMEQIISQTQSLLQLNRTITKKTKQRLNSNLCKLLHKLFFSVPGQETTMLRLQFMKKLIALGANSNIKSEDNLTPLIVATRMGNSECISWLLDQGACCRTKGLSGRTALHHAIQMSRNEKKCNTMINIIKLLLSKGALIDAVNINGESPLVMAIEDQNIPVATMLISHGADISITSSQGTPFDRAYARDHSYHHTRTQNNNLQCKSLLTTYYIYHQSVMDYLIKHPSLLSDIAYIITSYLWHDLTSPLEYAALFGALEMFSFFHSFAKRTGGIFKCEHVWLGAAIRGNIQIAKQIQAAKIPIVL